MCVPRNVFIRSGVHISVALAQLETCAPHISRSDLICGLFYIYLNLSAQAEMTYYINQFHTPQNEWSNIGNELQKPSVSLGLIRAI